MKTTILEVLVGSKAHGLDTVNSDTDIRGVFVVDTKEILGLNNNIKSTSWIEGDIDNTVWEIGKFLRMACACNPTILETFLAPIKEADKWGMELRELFPYVWNSVDVKNAFCGYSKNQEKKFLDKKDNRAPKYAAAYLRTLYNAYELLNTGTFTIRIADTEIGNIVRRFKNSEYTIGEVMQTCADWRERVEKAYEDNPKKETDIKPVNQFLLKTRKAFWE